MYKGFNHIKNVSEDGETATMLINKRIGNVYDDKGNCTEYGIQGDQFANEMLYLKAVANVKNIDVEINSIGGDVTNDGYNIVAAIIKHKANTIVTGLAASMAGLCAIAGEKVSIMDYGSIMCHPVSGGSGDNKILDIVQDSLKSLFLSRTRMNGDTIDNLFSKETWFSNSKKADYNLQDAIDKGIVHEVLSSGRKIKLSNTLTKDATQLLKFYNTINETKPNMDKITKKLKLSNNLAVEVVEDAAITRIENLETENTTLTNELATAKKDAKDAQDKLKLIEDAKTAEIEANATAAVKNAIKLGKIKNEQEASMLVLAKTDLIAFNALVGIATSTKEAVKIPYGGGTENKAEDRSDWTLYKWSKEDKKGLAAQIEANPDFVNTLKKHK